jgi:hypothetical protein
LAKCSDIIAIVTEAKPSKKTNEKKRKNQTSLLQFSNPKKREIADDTEKENESQDMTMTQTDTQSLPTKKTQSSLFSSMKVKQPAKDADEQVEGETGTQDDTGITMEVA